MSVGLWEDVAGGAAQLTFFLLVFWLIFLLVLAEFRPRVAQPALLDDSGCGVQLFVLFRFISFRFILFACLSLSFRFVLFACLFLRLFLFVRVFLFSVYS